MPDLFNCKKEAIARAAIRKLEKRNGGEFVSYSSYQIEPLTSGLWATVIVHTTYHGSEAVRVYESEVGGMR